MSTVERKKTPYKKIRKAQFAWVEQVYLEIDSLKAEIRELKKTVKYLSDELDKIRQK